MFNNWAKCSATQSNSTLFSTEKPSRDKWNRLDTNKYISSLKHLSELNAMLCGPLALQSSHKVACINVTQHKYSKFIDITSFCKCPLGFEADLSQNGSKSLCKHLFCYRLIDNDDLPRTMALPKSPHNSAPQKICPPWEHWPYKRTKFTVDIILEIIMIPLWRWYLQAVVDLKHVHSLNTKLCTLFSWSISSVCGTSEAFSKWDSK